ncbi:MAG: efflux RND transporter periplasmic adaptor subunit [Gemmatimonadaceae bacterium]|nr:efflux RND transporter periplasmic adaptor subunit [Gemmatimonadaceae bacterium]
MSDQINDRGTSQPAPIVPSPFGSSTRRSRVVRFGVITVLLVGAVLLALRLSRGNKTPENSTANADADAPAAAGVQPVSLDERAKHRIGVTYAPVTFGAMASEIRTVAQVTYDETRVRSISPKIDGWVEQLFVNYTGQPVAVGQPLLTIYSPMLVTAQQELLLAGKLGRSVAEAEGDARRGVSELREAARRRLQYWDISDAQIDLLEETGNVTRTMTLRSSVPGVVVQKNVLEGQRIMAGEALYQVADLSVVWLEGEVFEKDLSSIRLGQRVSAEFDALPGEKRSGRITYLYPTLNPDTRTARVRVAFANPGLQLKPGMYGTIRVEGTTGKPGLLVPRSAVLATGERSLVFVRLKDGRLEPRPVTIGLSTDTQTQILGGLAVGDTVVKSATFLVDAESNLGSALGGMGSMPGMDMTPPAGAGGGAKSARPPTKSAEPAKKQDKMPGMDSSGRKE